LPEVWIPYGDVETLVSVQGENLGRLVDPDAEKSTGETDRLADKVRRAGRLFVCDASPTTVEILGELLQAVKGSEALKVHSSDPRKLETTLPELKGRVSPVSPPQNGGELSQELLSPEEKLFIGTARPDPLFGILDPRVEACLGWVAGSADAAAGGLKDFEPAPFERTDAYVVMHEFADRIPEASFVAVVPRAGRVRAALEDAPFDAIKNGFYSATLPQARALIVGAGGRGYDDTLSSALRTVWGALGCVRKSGEILVLAECSEGLGSRALEMVVTGRIGDGRRREKYIAGLEEVYYLQKLRDEYDVLLLSGLPELYAKSKLGFTTTKGSGEAVGRLLNKTGRTAKLNVVTRASECRLTSA